MVLHKVSACKDRTRDRTVWRNSQRKLTAIWVLECGRKPNGQRIGEVSKRLSLVRMQPFAWEKKRFLWNHISIPVSREVWRQLWGSAHPRRRLIYRPSCASLVAIQPFACEKKRFSWNHKCSYFVTFDLDLDLEHILDAGRVGNHRVQVRWRSSLREEAIFVKSQVSVSRDLWPRPWAHLGCRPWCASLVAIQPFV